MKTKDIHIRDPFVLCDGGKYYLYGSRGVECWGDCTGLDVYVSSDLENWEGPHVVFEPNSDFWSHFHYWAPEVHSYRGAYYMFVSFKSEARRRGTQILKADFPMGPFQKITEFPITPENWECLDGTFYEDEEGNPHMIFCHEWTQVGNGEICAMPLSHDLTKPISDPVVLLRARDASWCRSIHEGCDHYVTDGPFMYRMINGSLAMLWSGFSENGYVEALSVSDTGDLYGAWDHKYPLFSDEDGGHGMLFRRLDGQLMFVMHQPNIGPYERPVFLPVSEESDRIQLHSKRKCSVDRL